MLLVLPQGVSLRKHHALSFGSTFADGVLVLSRKLLWLLVFHYVDDFSGLESKTFDFSGHLAFADLFAGLGVYMKEKKAQAPNASQKLLGVQLTCRSDGIVLAPCTGRVSKVLGILHSVLEAQRLSPALAQRIAGKVNFLLTTFFGQLGRAALHPVYSRAAGFGGDRSGHDLPHALWAGLRCLVAILQNVSPPFMPFQPPIFMPSVKTDAFFELGDQKLSPHADAVPEVWPMKRCHLFNNGWGLVIRPRDRVVYAFDRVPPHILRLFCSCRAFIFFLEVFAQVVSIVFFRDVLGKFWIAWIDNTAGRNALHRGFGRDPVINNLLCFAWMLLARLNMTPHFDWVPSAFNVADGVSRTDESDAVSAGWSKVDLDLAPFFQILARVALDLEYTSGQAVDDCLSLTHAWCRDGEVLRVGERQALCLEPVPEAAKSHLSPVKEKNARTATAGSHSMSVSTPVRLDTCKDCCLLQISGPNQNPPPPPPFDLGVLLSVQSFFVQGISS